MTRFAHTGGGVGPIIPDKFSGDEAKRTDIGTLFLCPLCREGRPAPKGYVLSCPRCGEEYPVVDGIPVLIAPRTERDAVVNGSDRSEGKEKYYNDSKLIAKFLCHRETFDNVEHLKSFLPEQVMGPVLEIGSGNGMFQNEFEHYLAFDYSLSALRTYIEPRHPRVCGSAEALPFAADSFDVVFTRATLEHVGRPEMAFAEILRVLKPGGVGYVFPAWHCRQWNCDGIPVRPFRDLTWGQRLIKLTIPLRSTVAVKALARIPWRLWRAAVHLTRSGPAPLSYRRLRPNYEVFWMSDSDACASIDSFDGVLYYSSRGCEILHPQGSLFRQFLTRSEPVIFRKPQNNWAQE